MGVQRLLSLAAKSNQYESRCVNLLGKIKYSLTYIQLRVDSLGNPLVNQWLKNHTHSIFFWTTQDTPLWEIAPVSEWMFVPVEEYRVCAFVLGATRLSSCICAKLLGACHHHHHHNTSRNIFGRTSRMRTRRKVSASKHEFNFPSSTQAAV